MKLSVEEYSMGNYYITCKNYNITYDADFAEAFDLSLDEYQNILISYNGVIPVESIEVEFENYKDVERAIDFLEPYFILYQLTK